MMAAKVKAEYEAKIAKVRKDAEERVAFERARIKQHKHDQKYGVREYTREKVQAVKDQYKPLEEKFRSEKHTPLRDRRVLLEEASRDLQLARKDKLMSKMQMIFQDPISSLNPRMTVREIIAEGLKIRGIHDKVHRSARH
jgi:oligopeptide transport system ATP-binding protein